MTKKIIKTDWEDKYKRALAEHQNLLKQTGNEKLETIKYANQKVLLEILPIYMHLKMITDKTDSADAWFTGLQFVVKQFKEALNNLGVKEIETSNKVFDHNTMEAISEQETEDEKLEGTVCQEAAAGYELNGRVIMPAKVIVYKFKNIN